MKHNILTVELTLQIERNFNIYFLFQTALITQRDIRTYVTHTAYYELTL